MLNEYNCWLQERIVPGPRKMNLETVYAEKHGSVAGQAAEELRLGIKRILGYSPGVFYDAPKQGVYLGLAAGLDKHFAINAGNLGAGGFIIKNTEKTLVIAGADEAGLLYGVFRFLFLLSLQKADDITEIREEPAAPLRMINHWDDIGGTVGRGYAGNSLFFKNNKIDYDSDRIKDYARLLSSIGINVIAVHGVNAAGAGSLLVTEEYLPQLAALAAIFRPYGIRLLLSVNFASPWSIGKLPTADPLDSAVAKWWKERADLIYRYIPDLAGFIVKADSEGEPGPFQYNRTQADGANVLARALIAHNGFIVWRCFVYNCQQDWRDQNQDRARAAFDHFMPLDGAFDDNVILQIKHGPYDFQVREPVTPLFGALKKTRHVMELQITQEYTGHQIDLCYLPWMWQDVMRFDTGYGPDSAIKDLARSHKKGVRGFEGFSSVVNTGLDRNWTGHTLAQANLYGYGRIIWDPSLSAEEIAREWSGLSFGAGNAAEKITGLLLKSYPAYEKYNAPFGVCFMVTPGLHYGPNIEGYEFSRWGTYHRADMNAIGIDRTKTGTGFTGQFAPKNAAAFDDPKTCPENVILFFHRLRYDFKMKNNQTLLQNIYDTHFEGYDDVQAMINEWKSLEKELQAEVYKPVLARFERQLKNAREWRDQINTYFRRKTGIDDLRGRKIYD